MVGSSLPPVLVLEEGCPASLEEIKTQEEKYFDWQQTYQNPLSPAYQSVWGDSVPRAILFNAARKYNFSFYIVAQSQGNGSSPPPLISPVADLKTGTVLNANALKHADLSFPYDYDYITFCLKAPDNTPNVDGFIQVFSPEVWLSLLVISLLCMVVFFLLSFSFWTKRFTLTARHSVAFILKNFLVEGHTLNYRTPAVQVFASVWIFTAFVNSTLYISTVVSSVLSHAPARSMPETFEDLVATGMKAITFRSEYRNVVAYLQGSNSHELKELAKSITTVTYLVNCQDAAAQEPNTACVAKFRGMHNQVETRYTDKNDIKRIIISKYRGPLIMTGFAMRKDSPFKGTISKYISQSTAAGLVDHWTRLVDHNNRRWGVGMSMGDHCLNQPQMFATWGALGIEKHKKSPKGHIFACLRYNLHDYRDIVEKHCVLKEDGGVSGDGSSDMMLKVQHLGIVFEASIFVYCCATLCFVFEVLFVNRWRFLWYFHVICDCCSRQLYRLCGLDWAYFVFHNDDVVFINVDPYVYQPKW